jgi:predicted phosphodiesterase
VIKLNQTLNIPSSDRIIIIGDVHGCFDELQDLLVECDYNPNQDYLIFVGDLVNKGPKSIEVYVFVMNTIILIV